MSKTNSYGLYQTFSNVDSGKKMTNRVYKNIMKTIPTLSKEFRSAIFLLIYEHYRIEENIDYDPCNKILPYDILFDINKGVHIDLTKLPNKLVFIIEKFVKMGK